MTRVLIGDALVNEDERLQNRMNQFTERVELALKQSLRIAVTQGEAKESEVATRANLIAAMVIGRWHRFAKSGFKLNPSDNAQAQIAMLLV
jgi:TetR/AcrR family transcriptional regulator